MNQFIILIIEDERPVLDALARDLEPFADRFLIEPAENVDDARKVVADHLDKDDYIALVLADHLMPGTSGVDYLVELNGDTRTAPARKVLVTAQAGLQDTVKAVNQAKLDHYIAKPWTRDQLHEVVRGQLTDYIIASGVDPLPYMQILDSQRLMQAVRASAKRAE